jgi:hypothetical protein
LCGVLLEWVGLGYVRLGSVGLGCAGPMSPGTHHCYLKVILRYFQGHFMIMSRSYEVHIKVIWWSFQGHVTSVFFRSGEVRLGQVILG